MDTLQHIFYINLAHREDRRDHVVHQLESIGLHGRIQRFEAIPQANGAIGCSMSHLRLLQMAKHHQWNHIMIVEDDITFTNPDVFITQLNRFLVARPLAQGELQDQPTWDVLLLAGNNIPPYDPVDEMCVKVSRCQTTTGYIVQRHYYDTLMDNIKAGLTHLIHHPEQHSSFALDKYWFALQQRDRWYLLIPLTVVQREGYSDIERKEVDYHDLMLDLDKTVWMDRLRERRQMEDKRQEDMMLNRRYQRHVKAKQQADKATFVSSNR